MNNMDLFNAITNLSDAIVEEADRYTFADQRLVLRSILRKWTAVAAAVVLVGGSIGLATMLGPYTSSPTEMERYAPGETKAAMELRPETGAELDTALLDLPSEEADTCATPPRNYTGPVLPLSFEEDEVALTAKRHISLDFTGTGEQNQYVEVTDSYTLRNDTAEEITVTGIYPIVSNYAEILRLPEVTPMVTLDGTATETELLPGNLCFGYTDNGLNCFNFHSFEQYSTVISERYSIAEPPELLGETVAVYEIYDQAAKTTTDNRKIRIDVTYDGDKTTLFTWNINGSTTDEEKGLNEYHISRSVEQSASFGKISYIICLGEAAEWTLKTEGLAKVREYETSLEEILRVIVRDKMEQYLRMNQQEGEITNTLEDGYIAVIGEHLTRVLAEDAPRRYKNDTLSHLVDDLLTLNRIFLHTFDLTIPAGEEAALTFAMTKEASWYFDRSGPVWMGIAVATQAQGRPFPSRNRPPLLRGTTPS